MSKTYEITGMKCQGCANAVTEKLSAVKGVEEVKVDLEKKQVTKVRKGGPKRAAFFKKTTREHINKLGLQAKI